MLQIYSKGCEYVIRAFTHINPNDRQKGFSIRTICKRARIPLSFTRKIFQALVRNGILVAKRGPGGGYQFGKDPNRISLLSIIQIVDGKNVFDRCVIKNSKCKQRNYCSLHPMWKKAKADLVKVLDGCAVMELMKP